MTEDNDIVGLSAQRRYTVSAADLAPALGSGDVPVLATPRMIAWMEAATVSAVADALEEGTTTVGTAVEIDHVAASVAGATVAVSATVRAVAGRAVEFDCEAVEFAEDGTATVVGHGSISRTVVDRERFLAKLAHR